LGRRLSLAAVRATYKTVPIVANRGGSRQAFYAEKYRELEASHKRLTKKAAR
jgi:hypothetical protein